MAYGFTCDRCGASYKRNNVILTTRGSKRSDHTLQGFALVDVKGILPRRFDLCDDCLCQLISWIHPTLNADMKKSDPEWLDMLKNTRMRAIYSTKVVEDANEERVEHNEKFVGDGAENVKLAPADDVVDDSPKSDRPATPDVGEEGA